jgi:hypothetical protein
MEEKPEKKNKQFNKSCCANVLLLMGISDFTQHKQFHHVQIACK